MKVLISRLSSLGDVVCTLPVASAIKSAIPDSHITWIVDERFAQVVRCCKAVDRVESARFTLSRKDWPVISEEYDVALDMQGLLKSALPVGLARAKRRLGYHWQREGAWFFSSAVKPDRTSLHVVDQYVDVGRAAGGKAEAAEFALDAQQADLEIVKGKLKEQSVDRFVAINPGAGWASKRWPLDNWAVLVSALKDRGERVLIIGGKAASEMEVAQQISEKTDGWPLVWVGQTGIGELIATLQLCAAHVGGDTGSTHIAAALNRPCVGLYSITNPKRSCPYGQIDRCLYDRTEISRITPEAVLQKL